MLTLLIIPMVALLALTIYATYRNKGVLKSLSISAYVLAPYHQRWMFTVTLVVMVFCLLPLMLQLTEGMWYQFISYFTVAPLLFTGVTNKFNDSKHEFKIHMASACMAALNSLAWSFCTDNWVILAATVFVVSCLALATKSIKTSATFWGEYACFITIFAILFKMI